MYRISQISMSLVFLLFLSCKKELKTIYHHNKAPEGMVWVENKIFLQGAKDTDTYAMPREKPAHRVTVDGFFIDITEVTNKQFKRFVDATQYITIAERKIDWEEIKKQLPKLILSLIHI